MLSGKAPFQASNRGANAGASAVMDRIRSGEFKFDGPSWDVVSDEAKRVIRGKYLSTKSRDYD